ncbi:MAG: hypothetical protein KF744_07285 [Taibaiella sp.]|nr:hypothetical protein [Taibaiella sp.]
MLRTAVFCLSFCLVSGATIAQIIHGEVLDIDNMKPVEGVSIENIYTNVAINSTADGAFVIAATSDQLLEFKKPGYRVTRVRIPKGQVPSYFRIIIEHGINKPSGEYQQKGDRYDYKRDSIRFHDIYAHELDFPRMSTIDKIKSPFSAMSKRNRMIWQFQDDYANFEREKYVDRTFNPALVQKITGLTGDSLSNYMIRFRPSYDQARGMTDYAFYNYIKTTGTRFRTPNRPIFGQ